jgi:penicillin-binding protein 1B
MAPTNRASRRNGDRTARRGRSRRGRRRGGLGLWRAIGISLALLAFGGGVFATRAVVRLDRVVRARFEGRLFTVPTRVYSAPTMLSAGLDVQTIALRETLRRLGYRESSADSLLATPGTTAWEPGRVRIHLRGFEHPTRAEPPRRIELTLSGRDIETIRDLETQRELAVALLEPETVGAYYGPEHEQRELVRVGAVPRHLIDAVLAVEDQRFEAHGGIDWVRVLGAAWANVRAGAIQQGGSTLTQQLVKNFFLTPNRTLERKIQEAAMAVLVEARYEKNAILEAYLNEIYLGQRGSTAIHGVGEAARFYFGKPVHLLRAEDSALLAALIRNPRSANPFKSPESARRRRDLVLDLMHEQGRLDAETHVAARAAPLDLADPAGEPRDTRYFLDTLRAQLPEVYDREVLATAGLRIFSTLDVRLQRAAAKAVSEGLADLETRFPELKAKGATPEERRRTTLQACLVALRPQTGEVLALVGGRDYGQTQFDRCTQSRRPAGSSFKPFVYAAALEADGGAPRITLATVLDDGPFALRTATGSWRPVNYDHQFHGAVSVRQAIERSYNVATARLGQQVGIERVVDVARRVGITSPLNPYPALALGAADVTPLEMARAYATFANGGVRPEVLLFEDVADEAGETLERRRVESARALDAGTAFLTVSLLEGVVDRGTARALRAAGFVGPIAGKTGTSDESKDLWFAGFTPDLVAVVWVGFDEPRPMRHAAASIALPIWQRFLKDAAGSRVAGSFPRPASVRVAEIDPATGALALSGCPRRQPEFFLEGTEPRTVCPDGGFPFFARGEDERGRPGARRDEEERARSEGRDDGGAFGRFLGRLFGR